MYSLPLRIFLLAKWLLDVYIVNTTNVPVYEQSRDDLSSCVSVVITMESSVVKYLSFKASKVRWQPTPAEGIARSTVLATGSGDEQVGCKWQD